MDKERQIYQLQKDNNEKIVKAINEVAEAVKISNAVLSDDNDEEGDEEVELPNFKIRGIRGKRGFPGIDGITPTVEDLTGLMVPLIPAPLKGESGHTPTKEEILDLIVPLIPEPLPAMEPSDERITDLIKPLIPEIQKIKPTKEELVVLIKPLIPKPKDVKVDYDMLKTYMFGQMERFNASRPTLQNSSGPRTRLTELADVNLEGIINGQTVVWDNVRKEFVPGAGGGGTWGSITGTVTNQTDLQTALNLKQNTITLTTTGTSGASTLVGATLNIPQYSGGGGTIINNYNSIRVDQSGGTSDTYGVVAGLINGVNKVYTVSQSIYATGTLSVYKNGKLMIQGTAEDWVETTPNSGTFTFNTAPITGDLITVSYSLYQVGASPTYNHIDEEEPTGVKNGVNNTFTLTSTPIVGSVHLYLNGIRIKRTDDYTVSGLIITTASPPSSADVLLADYRY